jgi:hypothetical protein
VFNLCIFLGKHKHYVNYISVMNKNGLCFPDPVMLSLWFTVNLVLLSVMLSMFYIYTINTCVMYSGYLEHCMLNRLV